MTYHVYIPTSNNNNAAVCHVVHMLMHSLYSVGYLLLKGGRLHCYIVYVSVQVCTQSCVYVHVQCWCAQTNEGMLGTVMLSRHLPQQMQEQNCVGASASSARQDLCMPAQIDDTSSLWRCIKRLWLMGDGSYS